MAGTGEIGVITGDGKGKTTAALGLALQAVGRGAKVMMFQFLKAPDSSGEHFAVMGLGSRFIIKPAGRKGFIRRGGRNPEDEALAKQAFQEARAAVLQGEYNLVILDEINIAVYMGLIEPADVVELAKIKPERVGLLFTGRYASPEVLDAADYVIEMKNVKHHFEKGVAAREGIEY
ncbi:MAG: cob(I)yrinic acid a,c-diamide adenosyltransferase [Desulfomonile sp.]|nr:cob(I)yrinic acid a,c-diamide adenosyltransferase [Desulfomonile sp.]